jgi:hypothetical protein
MSIDWLVVALKSLSKWSTHPEPPLAFPKTADFLPRLVMMAKPSTQKPLLI